MCQHICLLIIFAILKPLKKFPDDEKGFASALHIKQPSPNKLKPDDTNTHTTPHAPKAGYKDAEKQQHHPQQTSDETLSTTTKSSGPSTLGEPPQRGEALYDEQ